MSQTFEIEDQLRRRKDLAIMITHDLTTELGVALHRRDQIDRKIRGLKAEAKCRTLSARTSRWWASLIIERETLEERIAELEGES